ncbi:MAG: TniQ family protein [Acetobacteraceae bacterium]|nr:TniQ family protein [Acetobacteraceae bacterium]
MTYRLPLAVRPEPDESLPGFIMRNATAHLFQNPLRLFRCLGERPQLVPAIARAEPHSGFGRAALDLMGLTEDEGRRISLWHEREDHCSILGHAVPRSLCGYQTRAVCPACIAEAPYHRAIWLVDAMPVCAVHGIPLLRRCLRCDARLGWRGKGLHLCSMAKCGMDLRAAGAPSAPVPDAIAGLHRLFHQRRRADDRHIDLPPGETLYLAFMLGRLACGVERYGQPATFIEKHPGRLVEVLEAGWKAIGDWPDGFRAMLAALRARQAEREGRHGIRKEFGGMPYVLDRLRGEAVTAPVNEEFARYLASQEDLAVSAAWLKRYGGSDVLADRHMTLGEAARYLKVSAQTMMRLAAREGLFLVPPRGMGTPTRLRADRVKALKDRREGLNMKQEAMAALGVAEKLFESIEAAGLLPHSGEDERVLGFQRYRRADIQHLLARLEAKVRPVAKARAPGRGAVRLTRVATGRTVTVAEVCHSILEGRLSPVGLDPKATGLNRILVASSDLDGFRQRMRATRSLEEVAKELGVVVEAVRVWAAQGLLATVQVESAVERGRRVTEEGLAGFREAYLTPGDIAGLAGMASGRWATDRLGFLGVRPVAEPLCSLGIARLLYRRSDITPEVLARLRTPAERGVRKGTSKAGFDLAERVGRAVMVLLGRNLRRDWNGFSADDGDTHVQVVVGQRPRFRAKYTFPLHAPMRRRLDAAEEAWVALAFHEQPYFLFIPWSVAQGEVTWQRSGQGALYVPIDAHGRPGVFERWVRPLDGALASRPLSQAA